MVLVLVAVTAACAEPGARVVRANYDPYSGRLLQLSADQDGDGQIDQWTYLAGTRPVRGEKDSDSDGRVDRWEYFDARAVLLKVGSSSRNDGIEDTWTWVSQVNGEGRVDLSTTRDRRIDRHEYYLGTVLARAELDTNADGRVDRWDRYVSNLLREVQFDTSFSASRADRRLLYDEQGHFTGVEADDDRDGRFDRVVPGRLAALHGETIK